MEQMRRNFLKNAGIIGVALASAGMGMLKPGELFAAEAGKASKVAGATEAMVGAGYAGAIPSKDIEIKAPEIAENGAVVPVEVSSSIPGTTAMAIFVDKNPNPLVATFGFMGGMDSSVTTRIKLSETSQVRVAVKANGKTYVANREVKVTLGGCGGGDMRNPG